MPDKNRPLNTCHLRRTSPGERPDHQRLPDGLPVAAGQPHRAQGGPERQGQVRDLRRRQGARQYRPWPLLPQGDWRSGYYRDQTWMAMLGIMSLQQMFRSCTPMPTWRPSPARGAAASTLTSPPACSTRMAHGETRRKPTTQPRMSRRRARRCPLRGACLRFRRLSQAQGAATSTRDSPTTAMRSPSPRSAMPPRPKACSGKSSMPSVFAGARDHHGLRRRVWHLGAQPVPDGQGEHLCHPGGLRA